MTDISKQRNKLREFSNYKIRNGVGAIVIYDNDNRDVAVIYKPNGDVQIDKQFYLNIPAPNKAKFNEVVYELKQIAKAQTQKE